MMNCIKGVISFATFPFSSFLFDWCLISNVLKTPPSAQKVIKTQRPSQLPLFRLLFPPLPTSLCHPTRISFLETHLSTITPAAVLASALVLAYLGIRGCKSKSKSINQLDINTQVL